MTIKKRLDKLTKRRGPQGGGVVTELPGGGFRYQGQEYADLGDLPHGGGVLVIPETLPPERWDPLAVKMHREQEQLIMERGNEREQR
ncbi:MAG: hypothetical protein C4567_07620 [Deltaproteobacteria bacterium]|nr:MAG: hypothetical protein C4567_07620 [Deltaproteobacteria bacterium]